MTAWDGHPGRGVQVKRTVHLPRQDRLPGLSVEHLSVIHDPEPERRPSLLNPAAGRFIALADTVLLAIFALSVPGHRVGLAVFGLAAFTMLRQVGLQRPRLTLSVLDDLPQLSMILFASTGLTLAVCLAVRQQPSIRSLTTWLVLAGAALLLERFCAYCLIRWVRRSGLVSHPTLVIGCGRIGAQLSTALLANREYGLRPVGFVDDAPLLPPVERPVPLLSGTEDLATVIRDHGIDNVLVAFSSRSEVEMIDILRTCDRLGVEIFTVPRLFEMHSTARGGETVRGLPLVRLRRATFRSTSWQLKRCVDLFLTSLALVFLAPVLLACAVAVRLEGGPGIIFRQTRIGIDGAPFEVLKFRSLKPVDESESATKWNVANDDRMGPVGRTMRKLSLDELPQLWNIIKGDMSLVGPRPERPHFVDQFGQEHREYLHRHRVPCGLTGWAQVNGLRGDTSIGERARFDNFYIENWCLWLDMKIMIRTVAQVLRMTGN